MTRAALAWGFKTDDLQGNHETMDLARVVGWCYTGRLSNGRLTEQMPKQMTEQKLLDFHEPTDPD
jgi:hypothetical protein